MRIESINSNEMQYSSQRLTTGGKSQTEISNDRKSENVESNPQKKYTEEELKTAIGNVNKALNPYDRKLEFSVHEATGLISVKVIDTNKEEIIREIPPEKILDMVAKLWEMAGIIVDKKI